MGTEDKLKEFIDGIPSEKLKGWRDREYTIYDNRKLGFRLDHQGVRVDFAHTLGKETLLTLSSLTRIRKQSLIASSFSLARYLYPHTDKWMPDCGNADFGRRAAKLHLVKGLPSKPLPRSTATTLLRASRSCVTSCSRVGQTKRTTSLSKLNDLTTSQVGNGAELGSGL